jgi:hypothetical protein
MVVGNRRARRTEWLPDRRGATAMFGSSELGDRVVCHWRWALDRQCREETMAANGSGLSRRRDCFPIGSNCPTAKSARCHSRFRFDRTRQMPRTYDCRESSCSLSGVAPGPAGGDCHVRFFWVARQGCVPLAMGFGSPVLARKRLWRQTDLASCAVETAFH